MGAWAADAFGNDTACDWGKALASGENLQPIYRAFAKVLGAEKYLDSDTASIGVAACEVVARLFGQYGIQNPYTEEIDNWVKKHKDLATLRLIPLTDQVIDRVLGDHSELKGLWDGNSEWDEAIWDLRIRLNEIDSEQY